MDYSLTSCPSLPPFLRTNWAPSLEAKDGNQDFHPQVSEFRLTCSWSAEQYGVIAPGSGSFQCPCDRCEDVDLSWGQK